MIYLLIAFYLLGVLPLVIAMEAFLYDKYQMRSKLNWWKMLLISLWPLVALIALVAILLSFIPKSDNDIKYE